MSIKIRSKKFHYRFMVAGVSYSGICKGCEIPPGASAREIATLKKRAEHFEASERTRILRENEEQKEIERDIRRNKTVVALVENCKYELTGGHPVLLDEAFELAAQKPIQTYRPTQLCRLEENLLAGFLCLYSALLSRYHGNFPYPAFALRSLCQISDR